MTQLAMGFQHTCALTVKKQVICWGANWSGQLGYGHSMNVGDDEPAMEFGEVNVGGKVSQIVAGRSHTCALLEDGRVRCWGANEHGQLGYPNRDAVGDDEVPSSVEAVQIL